MSEEFFEKMTMKELIAVARSVGFSAKDKDGKLLPRDVLIDSLGQFEGAGMFDGMRRPNAKGGRIRKAYYNGQGKKR
tara:strand:+ start:628 stop:858 length:231 start_codon:yes stop_codon:yes gene_type:complete